MSIRIWWLQISVVDGKSFSERAVYWDLKPNGYLKTVFHRIVGLWMGLWIKRRRKKDVLDGNSWMLPTEDDVELISDEEAQNDLNENRDKASNVCLITLATLVSKLHLAAKDILMSEDLLKLSHAPICSRLCQGSHCLSSMLYSMGLFRNSICLLILSFSQRTRHNLLQMRWNLYRLSIILRGRVFLVIMRSLRSSRWR